MPPCEFKVVDFQRAEGQIQRGKCQNMWRRILRYLKRRQRERGKEKEVMNQERDEKCMMERQLNFEV